MESAVGTLWVQMDDSSALPALAFLRCKEEEMRQRFNALSRGVWCTSMLWCAREREREAGEAGHGMVNESAPKCFNLAPNFTNKLSTRAT